MNIYKTNIGSLRFIETSFWLIKLRWFAVLGIIVATWVADVYLDVTILAQILYLIAIILFGINVFSFFVTKYISRKKTLKKKNVGVGVLYFQFFTDLILLTVLLHFSGGVENPFIIYYIFHMILASIFLSKTGSYIVTTFALGLIGSIAFLECFEILPHYDLIGFNSHSYYQNKIYIMGVGFIFITTSYLVVYMTNTVSSKLKHREKAYRLANIELEKQDKIKNEYVLRLTHDIKGHLATIQNCLDVVIISKNDEDKNDFVKRAHKRTSSLIEFTRNLLILTRMRLQDKVEMSEFSIDDVINKILLDLKTIYENKNISIFIKTELKSGKIYGNQLSIEEAINNIVSNAIKYSPEKSKIEICLANIEEYIQIDVIDNGIGIPEDEQKNIFDEFYRASNVQNIGKDSAGFGLTLVKHIIDKHQGKINIESKPGNGTKVSIFFPVFKNNNT